jgi:YHS domain-containing protein
LKGATEMRSLVWAVCLCSLLSLGLIAAPAVAAPGNGKPGDAPAKKEQKDGKKDPKKDAKKPVNKMCPVEPEHEADPTVTTTYKGKVIGLCCEDCVKTFNVSPEKYVKKMK